MKRQQIEERIDVHGQDSVLAGLLVHFVVVGDSPVGDIEYPGISDGHAIGIAPDVFEYLPDSLGRRLGIDYPVLVKALLTDGLWYGKSLLLESAGQQIYETPPEFGTHGSHGEEKRCTSAAMDFMPYSLCINAPTGHDAVNMGVIEKIRSPRMEYGCHTSEQSLLGGKCINGTPGSLEHTVIELPLVSHRDRMQTVWQREYDMEIPGRDDFLPAALNPLLALLVLAFGTMAVATAVVADSPCRVS